MGNTKEHTIEEDAFNRCIIRPKNMNDGGVFIRIHLDGVKKEIKKSSVYSVLYSMVEILNSFNLSEVYDNKNIINKVHFDGDYPSRFLSSCFRFISFNKDNVNNFQYINIYIDYTIILSNNYVPYLNIYKNKVQELPFNPLDISYLIADTCLKMNNEQDTERVIKIINNDYLYKSVKGGNRKPKWWKDFKYIFTYEDLENTDSYWSYYILSKV